MRVVRRLDLRGAIAVASLIAVAAGPSFAQEDQGWKTTLWTGFEFQGETDLDDDDVDGDFEFWMISAGAGTRGKLGENVVLDLKSDYRAVDYKFDLKGGGEPWKTVHVWRVNPIVTYLFNENWSVFGGPIGEFAGEAGADFGDALRGGGTAGVGYRHGDRFSIALGAIVQSAIEDDAYVQPFVVVDWGITDGLRLSMEGTSSRGGDLRLGYTFGDSGFSLGVGGGFRRERFRLDDGGGNPDGVGEEEATVLKGHVGYAFGDRAKIELYAGSTIDGEFRLEDDDGDKIAKSDYDDAPFGGVTVSIAF